MKQLRIKEIFYSLQGEGVHSGKAAWFIRFGGCDIGCKWCDTKDAWNTKETIAYFPDQILQKLDPAKSKMVVLTGGEPLYYDLSELSRLLMDAGFFVHLETSGAYPLQSTFNWLCLSPKEVIPVNKDYYLKANEIKIVISDMKDLDFAKKQAELINPDAFKLLQPEWNHREEILPLLIDYIKNNPGWRLSLQIHKYIHIP